MKCRPILMSGPMVRALLAGTKTQTRRALRGFFPPNRPEYDSESGRLEWFNGDEVVCGMFCPYGKPGDRLWVRECYSGPHELNGVPPRDWPVSTPIWYWASGDPTHIDLTRPKPGMHMPRWASRITLEITGVRVERLADISEADAIAEGIEADVQPGDRAKLWRNYSTGNTTICPKHSYRTLWEAINGPGSWDASPWVWVLQFKRVEDSNA